MKKSSALHKLLPLAALPMAMSASAYVTCSPSASLDLVNPGQSFSLVGNCVDSDTGVAVPSGSETWQVDNGSGPQSLGTRSIPAGNLTVVAPTLPGETAYMQLVYILQSIDTGYGGPIDLNTEGGYPTVYVTLADPCAPLPGGRAAKASGKARTAATGTVCPQSQTTLDQLGQPLLAVQTAQMRQHLEQAQSHLRSLRTAKNLAPGQAGKESAHRDFNFYVLGSGDELRQTAEVNPSEFKSTTTSLSVGGDYRLGEQWVFGGNLGGSSGNIDFSGTLSKQKSKASQVTAYASFSPTASTYLSATVSYQASRFNFTRDNGAQELSFSTPRGHALGLSLAGGRDFVMGPWSVGPYLRWDSISTSLNAFDEAGSPSAVSVAAQRVQSDAINLGAQTQLSIPVSWGIVLPYVRLEWAHRKDSSKQTGDITLLSDNSLLYSPTALSTTTDYGNLALGVSGVQQGGVSWFADFESGLAQQGYRSQRFSLGLRFEL